MSKKPNCVSVKSTIETYLGLVTTENTFKVKLFWLNKFTATLPKCNETFVSEISIDHINKCLKKWHEEYDNSNTFNLGRQVLLGFIKWLKDEDFVSITLKKTNTICRKKPNSGYRAPYENREIKELVKQAKNSTDKRCLLVMILLVTIAPRASEIAKLRWKDVFRKNSYITLQRKGGELQEIPICCEISNLFDQLYIYLSEPDQNTYVFSSDKKAVPDRFEIYRIIKQLSAVSNVSFKGVHIFRNNLANEFDELKIENSIFLKNFGWKDERMKQIYVTSTNDEKMKNIQKSLLESKDLRRGINDKAF
ncbi:tyrosine-type recombinase/integrase [Metabacillus sp. cB07]|uniref:tyrosine-type recombinase/integrase n=1 Tax=Metabacillus sp. cB07 TaxID=2806989 RepID=UPI00193ADFE9|nr:tyrosine-type recombinase/integrase [Metabacillus sp. cB07]